VSDTSQGPGWWIASDGKWYPPEAAAAAAAPPPPPSAPSAPPIPPIPPPPLIPPPPASSAASGWQFTGADVQVGGTDVGIGAPMPHLPPPPGGAAPSAPAPGGWTPPPGWVPPPPPAGYTPPASYTEIIETPVSPFRKVFFTVLGVVVLLGMVCGGAWLSVQSFLKQNDEINAMPRGPVPEAFLDLEADARETIHLEHDGLSAGDSESPNRRAEQLKDQALSATITVSGPGPDGPTIPLEDVGSESVYGFGHEGIAVARLAVPEDGTYRVQVQGFPSTGEVAIGDVSFGGLFKDFGIGLTLFILGIFVAIPVFRARTPRAVRRARRAG
jgi:hypothetical protein